VSRSPDGARPNKGRTASVGFSIDFWTLAFIFKDSDLVITPRQRGIWRITPVTKAAGIEKRA
jgi:hypothetical protein